MLLLPKKQKKIIIRIDPVATVGILVAVMMLALMINEVGNKFFKSAVQTLTYLPHFISFVVVSNIFLELMGTEGPLNQALLSMNMVEAAIKFWQEPSWFWLLVTFIRAWKEVGWDAILYLSALAAIDEGQYEAAAIDGCGPVRTYFNVVVPMLKPTLISVGILEIMWIWNDYLLPSLVLDINEYRTIPIHIQYLKGSYGTVDLGATMALILLSIIPVIIFYLCCQKHIIKGVAAGAVKG